MLCIWVQSRSSFNKSNFVVGKTKWWSMPKDFFVIEFKSDGLGVSGLQPTSASGPLHHVSISQNDSTVG
jgi:hypothetical protein